MIAVARLAFALLLGVWLAGSALHAGAQAVSYTGLVVRQGDGALTYVYLGFAEAELSAMEVLQRSGLDIVTVSFGGLGQGVCSIDETGCPAADCRRRLCQGPNADDPFWKFFRQTEPGLWTEAQLGANGTTVHDGDIDGWSWSGTDAMLPALTLPEIAERAGYDGTGFDAAGATTGTVFRRDGGVLAETSGASPAEYLAGAAALVVGGVAVLVIGRRQRRARPA
jgi:hypothetical protein